MGGVLTKVNLLKTKVVSQSLEGEDNPSRLKVVFPRARLHKKEVLLKLLVILAGSLS